MTVLARNEVHVWCAELDREPADLEPLAWFLDAREIERAGRIVREAARRQFIIARALLRRLIARYQGLAPGRVAIEYGRHGKPCLPPQDGPADLRFNLSHCADRVLIAFARGREVGVDIERVRAVQEPEEVARTFLPAWRADDVTGIPEEARWRALLRHWTASEAYLKARGLGLHGQLECVPRNLTPDTGWRVVDAGSPVEGVRRWGLREIALDDVHVACLAVAGGAARVSLFGCSLSVLSRRDAPPLRRYRAKAAAGSNTDSDRRGRARGLRR